MKTPGSGRQKGTPNKSTAAIRAASLRLCPEMIRTLAKIARSEKTPPNVRVDAATTILHYGVGKPKEMHEHAGPDGGAIPVAADVKVHDKLGSLVERLIDRLEKRSATT
jgi:hypothetical protein